MGELVQQIHKGVNTIDEESLLDAGFVRRLVNWVYNLDDKNSIHKMPGRSAAAVLPPGGTTANTKGLAYLQFDKTTNKALIHSNSKFYIATPGDTFSAWTELKDQQDTPVAFSRGGSYLKTLPNGRGGYVAFTGADGERPLNIDEDLNVRFLGMQAPGSPTLSEILTVGTETRPDEGSNTGTWSNPDRARDGSLDTRAEVARTLPGSAVHTWTFLPRSGNPEGILYAQVGTESLPPEDTDFVPTQGSPNIEAMLSTLKIEVSQDGGTVFNTIFEQSVPIGAPVIVQENMVGGEWEQLQFRATLFYRGGVGLVRGFVNDIWVSTTGAGTTAITNGVYYYATTEVYRVKLDSGGFLEVESAPSKATKIDTDSKTVYGIKIVPNEIVNLNTDGFSQPSAAKEATLLYRNVYRTVRNGVWPNLGFVGSANGNKAELQDSFKGDPTGVTLGIPGIYTTQIGNATSNAAGEPPAFRDACIFKGALVCIPEDFPQNIKWGLPTQPDYFPFGQSFPLIQGARNEELHGIVNISDNLLLVMSRTQLFRIRDLPFSNQASFDVQLIHRDTLTSNVGLAGGPLSYATLETQRGHNLLAWVSDSGIWMTDGALPSERGMGVNKLSVHLNWEKDVDTSRLTESRLTYDNRSQTLWFDYYDPNGDRRSLAFHTAGGQWIQSGEDQMVPKISGPHDTPVVFRIVGELDGVIRQWSLTEETQPRVYAERTGNDNAGSDIVSTMEGGWLKPDSPLQELHIYDGAVYHSNWGASEALQLDVLARSDELGTVRTVSKRGVSLRGDRATQLGWINSSGQSFKVRATHIGKTANNGTRSLGPVGLRAETLGEIES